MNPLKHFGTAVAKGEGNVKYDSKGSLGYNVAALFHCCLGLWVVMDSWGK